MKVEEFVPFCGLPIGILGRQPTERRYRALVRGEFFHCFLGTKRITGEKHRDFHDTYGAKGSALETIGKGQGIGKVQHPVNVIAHAKCVFMQKEVECIN